MSDAVDSWLKYRDSELDTSAATAAAAAADDDDDEAAAAAEDDAINLLLNF